MSVGIVRQLVLEDCQKIEFGEIVTAQNNAKQSLCSCSKQQQTTN